MKSSTKKRFAFIGKSMLWSLCLYVAFMLTINWNDVKNTMTGNNAGVVVNADQQQGIFNKPTIIPASISEHSGLISNVIVLVKAIIGVTKAVSK